MGSSASPDGAAAKCQCSRHYINDLTTEALCRIKQQTAIGRDYVAARVSQETGRSALDHGSFPRDVEHSRDPPPPHPNGGPDTHSGYVYQNVCTRSCSPRGCTEHHQYWHRFHAKFLLNRNLYRVIIAQHHRLTTSEKCQRQLEQRRK